MKTRVFHTGILLGLSGLLAFVVIGCNPKSDPPSSGGSQVGKGSSSPKPSSGSVTESGHEKDDESAGWWCKEHGVPEKLCSQCLSEEEVKKQFKDKGDWCEEHNRAKSQCFKCDPKRYDYFAKLYKEKFGKEPPRPPEEEFKK